MSRLRHKGHLAGLARGSGIKQIGEARRVPLSFCPACNAELDGVSGVDNNASPSPGDYTVCIACGHVAAFTRGLRLRSLTKREEREVARDQRVQAAVRAVLETKGSKH